MDNRQQKGKDMASPSELSKKRNRPTSWVPRAFAIPRGQSWIYGMRWVEKDSKKWYVKHNETKYASDEFINRASLLREYPSIVWRLDHLHMTFLFE